MTVRELAKIDGFELLAGQNAPDRQITGGFCGDLLSWAMGRAKPDSAWVTVIGNVNVIAVAMLANVACVILAQDAQLDADAKRRADENNIAVLRSSKGEFEIAVIIAKVLNL